MQRVSSGKTRGFISILTAALILFSLWPVSAAAAADYSVVRVKLTVGTIQSLTINVDGNYTLKEKPSEYIYRKKYTVKISGSSIGLYDGSTKIYSGSSFTLVQNQGTEGCNNKISLYNDRYSATLSYLGNLQFKPYAKVVSGVTGNYIKVINHVYLEEYLYGVVPHEMSNSFPLEALKAQAVFARGYAIRSMDADAEYDVVDTSSDQVYKGYNPSNNNAIAAVQATKFKVLKYNGSIISTYYSASNGGEVEITPNIWTAVTPKAYQVVKADPYDIRNTSTPQEKKYFPVNVNDAAGVPAMDKIKYNYMMPLLVKAGYLDKNGEEISITTDFSFKNILSMTGKVPSRHTQYADHDGACTHVESVTMKVTAGTYTKTVNAETQEVTYDPVDFELTFTIPVSTFETWKIFTNGSLEVYHIVESKDEGGNVTGYTLRHGRYGHGAGLSQRGAQQMGKEGLNYEQILTFYHPNTSVETASSITQPTLAKKAEPVPNAAILNNVNFRSAPDASSSIYATLAKNTKVYVAQSFASGDWHKVIHNGYLGYIHKDYISFISVAAIAPETAHVKETADPESADVAVLGSGVFVNVLSTEGELSHIEWKGITGYLAAADTAPSNGAKPALEEKGTALADITAKAGPGEAYSDYWNIAKGASVEVVQKDIAPGWHKVWAGGNIAYVPAGSVAFVVKPSIVGLATVTSASVNVRTGPGTSYSKVCSLVKGNKVEVVKKYYKPDWHQIWYNNKLYYVHKDYVSVSTGTKAVLAAACDLKSAASDTSKTLAALDKGITVYIYSYTGNYAYVNYAGKTGYIAKSALPAASAPAKPAVTGLATVISSTLNVRTGPGTNYGKAGTLLKGNRVEVVKKYYKPDWHQVWYKGKTAYVHKSYVSVSTGASAVLTADSALKASASSSSATLASLEKGAAVKIYYYTGSYAFSNYSGKTGYILKSALSASPTASKPAIVAVATVTSTTLNIRSGPGTDYAKVGMLYKGNRVEVVKKFYKPDWHQVWYNNKLAYLHKSYVSLS